MKKAYIVIYEVTSRVIIDTNEKDTEDHISTLAHEKASFNILERPEDYITDDNIAEVKEDIECPYGTLEKSS